MKEFSSPRRTELFLPLANLTAACAPDSRDVPAYWGYNQPIVLGQREPKGTIGNIVEDLMLKVFKCMFCCEGVGHLQCDRLETLLYGLGEAPLRTNHTCNEDIPFPRQSYVTSALVAVCLGAPLDKNCNSLMIIVCYFLSPVFSSRAVLAVAVHTSCR